MSNFTAADYARKLTGNQIAYLAIVDQIWSRSDVFVDEIIEDIEDTEGFYDVSAEELNLDFVMDTLNDDQVERVVENYRAIDEQDMEDMLTMDIVEAVLGKDSSFDHFGGVEVTTTGNTGSYAYRMHNDDDVSVIDILEAF